MSAATVITATPAEGKIASALAWGVEVTTLFSNITGTPASFFADAYGPFGQLTWMATHADLAAADAAEAALQANPDYLRSIDGAGDLLVRRKGKLDVKKHRLLPALAQPSWLDPATGGPK